MNELDKNIQKKVAWEPHKGGQRDVLDCKNKEVLICAGRGWGKSMLMGYIVFRELAEAMKAKKSFKCFIVAPTYDLTAKVFEHFISSFLLKYNRELGKKVSGGNNRPYEFKISADVWIQCKTTSEPMSMLGERVDLLIVDEAARIPKKVYYQYLRPIISSANRKSLAYYISTPRGKNWFMDKFYMLKDKDAAFQYSAMDGVIYTDEMIAEERKQWPELLFRQEYEAEFVSESGMVFKNMEDIVVPGLLRDVQLGHRYVMGVDVGKEIDFTVLTVMDSGTNELVHIDRFKNVDYPLIKAQIIAKAQRYNNARITMDTTGVGAGLVGDLIQSGCFIEEFNFNSKSKQELIGKLIVYIENKYIKIPDYDHLVDELKAFEYKYVNEKTGENLKVPKYEAPTGYHDDCVDSLALAVWNLNPDKAPVENKLRTTIKERSHRTIQSDL